MANPKDESKKTEARAARPSGMPIEVRPGDLVTVHYTSRNPEGGVFETSLNRRPLQFVAGRNAVIAGLSNSVIGMNPGERRTIRVPPEEGFGRRDPSLEQVVSRRSLPETLMEGDQLTVTVADRDIDVWVKSLDEESAVIDANHPLAGETLVVEFELVSYERPKR